MLSVSLSAEEAFSFSYGIQSKQPPQLARGFSGTFARPPGGPPFLIRGETAVDVVLSRFLSFSEQGYFVGARVGVRCMVGVGRLKLVSTELTNVAMGSYHFDDDAGLIAHPR